MTTARRFLREAVENIYVPPSHRPVRTDAVEALAKSMKELGLLVPIIVRYRAGEVTMDDGEVVDTAFHLVAGRHRLEAARLLGWEEIECEAVKDTDRRIRMMEIAENLHRADLTVLERQEQTAEYLLLASEEDAERGILAQLGPKPGRPESGVRAAARDLGIERHQAQRATKIAALAPEAKAEAKILHLDDNQSALLKAARAPKEEQLRTLREHAQRPRSAPAPVARDPLNDLETVEHQVDVLMAAWNKAGPEAREKFLERIDRPVAENTVALRA